MSVVKINVLEVPEGRGEVLEERFAARAGEVEQVDGFESFDLLRPTEGTDRYLVVTRWRDEEAFQAWMTSAAFARGHAGGGSAPHGAHGAEAAGDAAADGADGGEGAPHADGASGHGGSGAPAGGGHGAAAGGPAASGSELWGFEVVTSARGEHA